MTEENLKKLEIASKMSSDQKVELWLRKAMETYKQMLGDLEFRMDDFLL